MPNHETREVHLSGGPQCLSLEEGPAAWLACGGGVSLTCSRFASSLISQGCTIYPDAISSGQAPKEKAKPKMQKKTQTKTPCFKGQRLVKVRYQLKTLNRTSGPRVPLRASKSFLLWSPGLRTMLDWSLHLVTWNRLLLTGERLRAEIFKWCKGMACRSGGAASLEELSTMLYQVLGLLGFRCGFTARSDPDEVGPSLRYFIVCRRLLRLCFSLTPIRFKLDPARPGNGLLGLFVVTLS